VFSAFDGVTIKTSRHFLKIDKPVTGLHIGILASPKLADLLLPREDSFQTFILCYRYNCAYSLQ
jgi:hypothetical protein